LGETPDADCAKKTNRKGRQGRKGEKPGKSFSALLALFAVKYFVLFFSSAPSAVNVPYFPGSSLISKGNRSPSAFWQ
jgi:hypothetical protein